MTTTATRSPAFQSSTKATFGWTVMRTPRVAYTLVDAVNRAALATGSAERAIAGASADWNGTRVDVDTGAHRGWRAHYTWSGINWIERGASFEHAVDSALSSSVAKARGGFVEVTMKAPSRPTDEDASPTAERVAFLAARGFVTEEEAQHADAEWMDWRYGLVHEALSHERRNGGGAVNILLATSVDSNPKAFWDAVYAAEDARRGRKGGR